MFSAREGSVRIEETQGNYSCCVFACKCALVVNLVNVKDSLKSLSDQDLWVL